MQVYLPYMEILRGMLPVSPSLERIKAAGFDGVECHLIGDLLSPKRVEKLRKEISGLGLDIRFHQGWSYNTGQRNLLNMGLRPLGALVPTGMPLYKQVQAAHNDSVVVYGNQVSWPATPATYIFQTASEHVNGRAYAMTFQRFLEIAETYKIPVVFDTQHVIEWYLNKENVVGLPTNRKTVFTIVEALWNKLRPFVKEIHLCDFNPSLGASRGRNVFLGNGVFPLKEFCSAVNDDGWDGVVTPEVAPQHLGGDNLKRLRDKVDQLFR